MKFESNIIELGKTTKYVRIPMAIAKYMGINPGQSCEIEVKDEKTIVVKFE